MKLLHGSTSLLQRKLTHPAVNHCFGIKVGTVYYFQLLSQPFPWPVRSCPSCLQCRDSWVSYQHHVWAVHSVDSISSHFYANITPIYPRRFPGHYILWYSRNNVFLCWARREHQSLLCKMALKVSLSEKTLPAHKCLWDPVCECTTNQHLCRFSWLWLRFSYLLPPSLGHVCCINDWTPCGSVINGIVSLQAVLRNSHWPSSRLWDSGSVTPHRHFRLFSNFNLLHVQMMMTSQFCCWRCFSLFHFSLLLFQLLSFSLTAFRMRALGFQEGLLEVMLPTCYNQK